MMYWDSGWAWLWMTVMMVIFWGTVAAVIVIAIVRRPSDRGTRDPHARDILDARFARDILDARFARDILDARFARGEIDTDDYRQRRNILDGTAAE